MGSIKLGNMVLLMALWLGVSAVAVVAVHGAAAPATQPLAALQLRANEAMARGEFDKALPMLVEVAKSLADKPDELAMILEQERVCKRQIKNPVKTPLPAIDLSTNRKPHAAPVKGQTIALTIKELGNFDYNADKGGGIPNDVTALEGVHIRTSGFMVPLDQAERIRRFALVPSLTSCCSGQPPQIQHTIDCQTPADKALEYTPDAITVEGVLHVHEDRDHGFIVSIFQLETSSVKLAEN